MTPSAGLSVHRKGKYFIVYPKGDPLLDNDVIGYTLAGLEKFPLAGKPFEKALKIYLSGEQEQYRNLLDELRVSLEQLLREIFNNRKSLENQRDQLLPWLKNKNLHTQVVNLYEKLLRAYEIYQNDAVKHNEAFSVHEVEFMIYLTGNFMRLILKLHRQDA